MGTEIFIFDLDGTLVPYCGLAPLPGVSARLKELADGGARLAIATNQAGPAWHQWKEGSFPPPTAVAARFSAIIARLPPLRKAAWFVSLHAPGLEEEAGALPDYEAIRDVLRAELARSCPRTRFHISADPDWRKPAPGMLLAAARQEPEKALFVGDRESDEEAARQAGISFEWAEDFFGRRG